jgi:hypothetical protein
MNACQIELLGSLLKMVWMMFALPLSAQPDGNCAACGPGY